MCPLCVQPFSSMVGFEYSSEYDESYDFSPNFIPYTGRSIFDQIYISEQPTSPSQVNVSHAPTRVFMRVGEELREITHRGASSRCAVTESSSEDNLSTLHTTFTQQPVSSEQSLENLDSFPSSLQSHLAVMIIVLILIFVLPSCIYTNAFISTAIS